MQSHNYISMVSHTVIIIREDGSILKIQPGSGLKAIPRDTPIAVVDDDEIRYEWVSSLELDELSCKTISSLEVIESVEQILICSAVTAPIVKDLLVELHGEESCAFRVCSPGELVKNDDGQPVGCRGLRVW